MVEEKINDGICINLRDWKMRKRSWIIVDDSKTEIGFDLEVVRRAFGW